MNIIVFGPTGTGGCADGVEIASQYRVEPPCSPVPCQTSDERRRAVPIATNERIPGCGAREGAGETMKKHPAKRNPMAREVAKAQYRRRIKPDRRRAIEAKRMKRPVQEK